MKTWNVLLLLFCLSSAAGRGQEAGVLRCEPQSLNLTSFEQKLWLKWEDGPSCTSATDTLVYELTVHAADKQVHHEEATLMPEQMGRNHSWTWTSHLPLECAPHSVTLTYWYNNTRSRAKQTLPGIQFSKVELFPKDKVFRVGSEATFCCMVPPGDSFTNMYIDDKSGTNMGIGRISSQVYAMTVLFKDARGSLIDVTCETNKTDAGTGTVVDYPPADRDLQCETRDLASAECQWSLGREDYWYHHNPMEYHLLGREEACLSFSDDQQRQSHQLQFQLTFKGHCSLKFQVDVGETNWTLTAQNKLGKVTLHDHADLSKRVRMLAPQNVAVTNVNARNASLQWRWGVRIYYHLNTTCQIHLTFGKSNTVSEVFGLGLNLTFLTDLKPNVFYQVKMRCGTAQDFWKWGDWSKSVGFHTKTDVPEAVDVWMQRSKNKTMVVWKLPLANQSRGLILDHTIALTKASGRVQLNRTTVPHSDNRLMLNLDPAEEYIVSITARNINGSSPPATITIPTPDETQVKTSRISGTNGAFSVSWRGSPEASCGYIVDWYPVEDPWSVDWMKLPPNQTSANITSKHLTDGCRYFLSVYACTRGSPVLVERREGYATETRIQGTLFQSLNHKQRNLDVEVSWDPIPLSRQTAYIHGYNLYCWNSNKHVVNVSTADPEATSLTAKGLEVDLYEFTVTAQTAVGECCKETFSFTLNSPTDKMTMAVLFSLGALFLFLFFVRIICYKQWRCIKQKVFPPIPKPVLGNRWMTSPVLLESPFLLSAQVHPIDIPQLCNEPKAAEPEPLTQDGTHWTSSQTPAGYCNQPLKIRTASHLSVDSAPFSLPSSSFRGDLQNPSYNLKVWSEDRNSGSEQQLLDTSASPTSSSQYKPQTDMGVFRPLPLREESQGCIPCDSDYISLPQ
uniref:Fibronectin type-III domain-containing protein n=1 Tax=Oryzias latipes TaxID=8090 RepID=A0A3P9LMT7_ORYLA